jgi:energy-coupling factor transport system ATP-binding protein
VPIEIENLTYKYLPKTPLEKEVLRNLSLRIDEGQFVGIIGRTGSGKSTLIQHLNGLLKPWAGNVRIDGMDTKGRELKELRKKVSLVFQFPEYQLFEETVFKDIAYGISKLGLPEGEIRDRVLEAADSVGLHRSTLDKSPFELSGGQKRRAAIAGVIVMRTKYLVMDEPGSGLDPSGRNEILSLVSRLHRENGVTVIIVSHNMSDIAKYVDRVLVLDNGVIAIDGAPDKVFSMIDELEQAGLRTLDFLYLLKKLKAVAPDISVNAANIGEAADVLEKMLRG